MTKYVSFVLTGEDQGVILKIEKVLTNAGVKSQYGHFNPAIPQLKANFTLTVAATPEEAATVRRRVEMVVSNVEGGDEVSLKEFMIQKMSGGDK